MHSRIVLVGFPGSGKSTIGKKLAKQLDYRFVDLDQEIEKRVQLSIPAIFEQFGETQFRIWEQTQLQETLQLEKVVIATGGGTPCFYQNMELITQHSEAVYVQMSTKSLFDRLVHSKKTRPLIRGLSDQELMQFVENELLKREQFYLQAHHVVKGENIKIEPLIKILEEND